MKRIKIFVGLMLIFIVGYYLRVMFLRDNILTFGYDQARDAISALQITQGHLKIFGPPASQPGLFHGVFYYYLLSPAYLIGKGSPIAAAYWIAFVNCLSVFVIFYLTYLMTKKNLIASFLASFLFAVSFEATQYATWLSNPTTAILTVPLTYLGLWLWTKENKRWGVVIAGISLGLSVQSEIFLIYQAVPLLIWLAVMKKSVTRKDVITFVLFFLLSVSTMALAQFKFGIGATINGIKGLAVAQDPGLAYAKSIGDYLILYLNQAGRIFAFNSYPGNIGYGAGFVFALIFVSLSKLNKSKEAGSPELLLSLWLLSHLSVVTVGGTSTPFLMVGIGPAVSIIIALYVSRWWVKGYKFIALITVLILTFGNISMIMRENKNGSTLFAIQKDMVLQKQMKVIDFTYQKTNGQPFSLNTLTSPLWINIVWSYLYKWYGQPKYGYLPYYHGHDQIGILDSLPKDPGNVKNYFLILEPMGGIPSQYLGETVGQEDSYSKVVSEVSFGELVVQQRLNLNAKK